MRCKCGKETIQEKKLSDAVKLIVIGLLLGTVFTFGEQFWSATVTRDECTVVETTFVDYEYHRRHRRGYTVERLSMECSDGETYIFHGELISKALRDSLASLSPNEPIILLLHPNGNQIMELATEDEVLLTFDEAMELTESARTGFFYLGILMYGGAVYGGCKAIQCMGRVNNQKKHR